MRRIYNVAENIFENNLNLMINQSIKLIKAEKVSDKHLTDKKLHEIWEHAKDLLKKNDI